MSFDSFENSQVRAYWNKDLNCVVLDAKGSVPSEVARAGVASALELMQRHGTTKVMADQNLLQVLAGERASLRHSDMTYSTQRSERALNPMADYLFACGR